MAQNFYQYHIYHIADNYAYMDTKTSVRGATGAAGPQGPQGIQGSQGLSGSDGAPGAPGFSPIVTVTDLEGGHRVTIEDLEGARTFDVMDGEAGSAGPAGAQGPIGPAGPKGDSGDTPYIGSNGNWWFPGYDTGVSATGATAENLQADMEENNPEKSSYIKNRTHWVERSGGDEIIPQQDVKITSGYGTAGGMAVGISEGTKYILTVNGTEYTCIGQNYKGDLVIGNTTLVDGGGEDTGEPVALVWFGAGTVYTVFAKSGFSGTASIKVVSELIEIYHKLSPNYLPEGIGWTEGGVVELLPETTVEFDPDGGEAPLPVDPPELTVGETYIVTWNGTEYECVGQEFNIPNDDGSTTYVGVCLGDLGGMMGGDSTGEPFLLVVVDPTMVEALGTSSLVAAIDGSTSATVSIVGNNETVHPIESKFLPDYLPKIENRGEIILPETVVEEISSDGTKTILLSGSFVWEEDVCYDVTLNGETSRYIIPGDSSGQIRNILIDENRTMRPGNLVFTILKTEIGFGAMVSGLSSGDTISITGPVFYRRLGTMLAPKSTAPLVVVVSAVTQDDGSTKAGVNVLESELFEAIFDNRPISLVYDMNATQDIVHYSFSRILDGHFWFYTAVASGDKISVSTIGIQFTPEFTLEQKTAQIGI